jgi:hypothetical protein
VVKSKDLRTNVRPAASSVCHDRYMLGVLWSLSVAPLGAATRPSWRGAEFVVAHRKQRVLL